MFRNAYLNLANALKSPFSPLRTPPLSFKEFYSPITTSSPFSQQQQEQQQKRNFFRFSDILSSKKIYDGHKLVGYTQKQLYDVVSNIDEYHLFIPYCTSSEVLKTRNVNKRTKKLTAALGIGFKGISEAYVSEVTCERPGLVQAEASSDALFSHLKTVWQLTPHHELPSTHCYLSFYLEFEFSSLLYSQLAITWFDKVSELVISSFEKRCYQLYGPPAPPIEKIN